MPADAPVDVCFVRSKLCAWMPRLEINTSTCTRAHTHALRTFKYFGGSIIRETSFSLGHD
jgi:hypothetical protein